MQNQEQKNNNRPQESQTSMSQNDKAQNTTPISYSSAIKNSLHAPGGIELPKGGGAIRGIGEKAEVNPVNGSGSVSIPIPLTSGRSGFTPQLGLSYSSGAGNSEFGLGWNVGLPEISRKTDKELPLYHDLENSDTFILSGAEDLVPVCNESGNIIDTEVSGNKIRQYIPRTEGLNAKIERITKSDGYVYWRVTSKDNIVSLYGFSAAARIADPENDKRIFSWKLEYTMDSLGNLAKYAYVNDASSVYASSYLSTVEYGNISPVTDIEASYTGGFYFSLEFVYDSDRNDAFSVYRPGFEVRNTKLCSKIEMHHNIGDLQQKVKELSLSYDNSTGLNLLSNAVLTGYDLDETPVSLPAIEFSYSLPEIPSKSKTLDSTDLENMPAGLSDGVSFADLWGEGISGVLIKSTKAWYYKPNLGNRQWFDTEANDEIDLGKAFVLKELPNLASENPQAAQLTDIDGDGLNEIQIMVGSIKGFHSFDESGKLSPFVPFKQMPNIDFNDPNIKMLDLNGDGYPDLLISEENCFLVSYSKSKEGYGNLQRISKAIDEENGPRVIFSELQQTIFLADMCGDGLTDIVRIKNGSICYWPNLGYGKFGKKVQMKNAPRFDSSDMFDPSRIRMADIDGSGTTDIIYLGVNETNYWKNLSGNSWSEAILIPTFPKVGSLTNVSVFDIEGNGTSALVWSTPLPGKPERIKYIELTGGKKPFLLSQINNNMGATRSLFYTPSTKFYLQDKKAGKPWITKLGFPVHVVERIEVYDEPTNSKYVSRYAYHHGYFDGYEREFRGFGMVEQWDTDDFNTLASAPLSQLPNLSEGDTYPMYTKTWFHTGFYKNADAISDLYKQEYFDAETNDWLLPDTILPEGLNIQEKREAARVLRGSALRQEIYSQDGSEKEGIPYSVTENSFKIIAKQQQFSNKHAVFMVLPSESINLNYERVQADPRIVHTLNLEYDEFGNPKKQATVAYPRLDTENAENEQLQLKATLIHNSFINDTENNYRHIGVPYQVKQFEIHNLNFENEKFSTGTLNTLLSQATEIDFATTPSVTILQLRLIQHKRTLFWDETLTTSKALGEITAQALIYRNENLCFTSELINKIIDEHVAENAIFGTKTLSDLKQILTSEGKFVDIDSNDNLWQCTDKTVYSNTGFYLPLTKYDPMGNSTVFEYDSYKLLPVSVKNAYNNEFVMFNDYVQMQVCKIKDPNLNYVSVKFNGIGLVVAQAIMGKEIAQGEYEADTLENPNIAFVYNLQNWQQNNEPVYIKTFVREKHGSQNALSWASLNFETPGENDGWIESVTFSDGLGNELMTKKQAKSGLALSLNQSDDLALIDSETAVRWLTNSRVVLNNKAKPVIQYEPYFTLTNQFENYPNVSNSAEYIQKTRITYDSASRPIRTDFADGTFIKTEFTNWQQKIYDQNDTVTDSQWYSERMLLNTSDPQYRAALLSAEHATTPQVLDFDNLGRVFQTIVDNNNNELVVTKNTLDIAGNIISVKDALERQNTSRFIYDMLNQPIFSYNIDNGKRWMLTNAAGQNIRTWDNKDNEIRTNYDLLIRPVENLLVTQSSTKSVLKTVYGTSSANNSILQTITIKDQSGQTDLLTYDFKGNLLSQEKTFCTDYQNTIDWDSAPILQDSSFEQSFEYDALNRPTKTTLPDSSEQRFTYNKSALLESIELKLSDSLQWDYYITGINYNEKGQRKDVYFGNNTKTRYYYDLKNFRLTRLLTTKNTGQVDMQDINYVYDAVGNIVSIRDDVQKTVYFNNSVIQPENLFEYDALYRLIKAQGREYKNLAVPTHVDFANNLPVPNTDSLALQNYTHEYSYDKLGNIIEQNSLNSWSREFYYTSGNNYLLRHEDPGSPVYTYDSHGNMLSMPHLTSIDWDYKDQMISATDGTVNSYYNYDASGMRSRKVVVKLGGIREERYYVGGYEVFKKYLNNTLNLKRKTINIHDVKLVQGNNDGNEENTGYSIDKNKRIAIVDLKTVDNGEIVSNPTPVIRYQYDNHLGSACLELDESAYIISYEEYHPFGTTSYRSGSTEAEVSLKKYKYVGKERDEETGLYYYGARYYAAWLGRWTSVDPLMVKYIGLSPFNYCLNNPIAYNDPDGKKPKVTITTSEDGLNVTISILNTVYVYGNDYKYDEAEVNKYLHGGKVQIGDKTVDIQIKTEIIYVDSLKEAIKRIDENEGYGVIVQNSLRIGTSFYSKLNGLDIIKIKEDNRKQYSKESTLAHEIGHDLGFSDKYVRVLFKSKFSLDLYKNALMGDQKPLSDLELSIIAYDVIVNNSVVENNGYPVITDLDKIPIGTKTIVTETNEQIPENQRKSAYVKIIGFTNAAIGVKTNYIK